MKAYFLLIVVILSGCQLCFATPNQKPIDYSTISPREIAATAAHLSRLLHDAQYQTQVIQGKYDDAQNSLKAALKNLDAMKTQLHETAKERDVVVICFACVFALGIFSSMGRFVGSLPLFEQILVAVALLAAGYGIGRYILFYLAHLIP